CMSWHNNVVLF
nr:immunoglobulin light chain junction region [Macaca mulatta]